MSVEGWVVFQDFFYHWSATLIAAFGIMFKEGLVSIESSAASSLACRVIKKVDVDQIQKIDDQMSAENSVPESIDFLIKSLKEMELDRKTKFLPRLNLAKIQWLYGNGRYSDSAKEVAICLKSNGNVEISIINDFLEMMGEGFSIRRLYEKDHRS